MEKEARIALTWRAHCIWAERRTTGWACVKRHEIVIAETPAWLVDNSGQPPQSKNKIADVLIDVLGIRRPCYLLLFDRRQNLKDVTFVEGWEQASWSGLRAHPSSPDRAAHRDHCDGGNP